MKHYTFCETISDLVNLIVDRTIEFGSRNINNFGTINFKVEDTPTKDKIVDNQLEKYYSIATGVYGISTIDVFDQEGIQLIFGYYGGTEGIQSVYFDDNYEIDRDKAAVKILDAINSLLRFEEPSLKRNFIVKVID